MKSYNHLFEVYTSEETIRAAINASSKGKRDRPEVIQYLDAGPEEIARIRSYAEHFHNRPHVPVQINEGTKHKLRTIVVPRYGEQIVHHMIVIALTSLLTRGMYYHNYASIPGRGSHLAKRHIERYIRRHKAGVKYCLKMDIRKFFDSVLHDILLAKLRRQIHDERFMKILEEVIGVTGTDRGLPLGFYTSQWFSNWYLQGLDHYITERLGCVHFRYMDDIVIFGANKRRLHFVRRAIGEYLKNKLGLTLKENWQVFRFDYIGEDGEHHGRFLDFMGFRFYRDRTTLRRSIMLKATRKARKISKKERPTIYDARQMLSYYGWIIWTNTHGMSLKWITPFISFKRLRSIVARHDKEALEKEGKDYGVVQRTERGEARDNGYNVVPAV